MTLKKYVKSRLKFRLLLLSFVIFLIVITVIILQFGHHPPSVRHDLTWHQLSSDVLDKPRVDVIVPEKYNERDLKERLIKEKIKYLTQHKDEDEESAISQSNAMEITPHVHIFYSTHVQWFDTDNNKSAVAKTKYVSILGYYSLSNALLDQHFAKIAKVGIGVVIVTKTSKLTDELFEHILTIAPKHKLAIATEFLLRSNQSSNGINQHIRWLQKFSHFEGLYTVFSISRNESVPFIYVKNAFEMDPDDKHFCANKKFFRKGVPKAILIGHIKLKYHTELMRRLCFDGFYPRIPSNGATFASTWKNWAYLKTFAQTYKMFFIPTVGPGYEVLTKRKHQNVQRHRVHGRYYGVAWRTAISTYIGFVSISSFNNFEEGTQIEEARPDSLLHTNYSPAQPAKYLNLTTQWVGSFLRTARQSQNSCYEFLNNTLC